MTANEKVLQFVAEYHENVVKYKNKIDSYSKRINDIKLEMKYVNDVELKAAIEIRLMDGDDSQEKKVRKLLASLEAELKKQHEELPVLEGILQKYIMKSGEEAVELNTFYRTEKQLQEQKAVANMLHAKKLFTDEIIKHAAVLREVSNVEQRLQEVLFATGRKNGVYYSLNIPKGVQLSEKELTSLVMGTGTNEYLNKYADKKNL
ncbi:MAG: hypothetical protein E6778_06655 [Niallia nealsonii]|nr:hypothetical protein [Niallia nealsonii]